MVATRQVENLAVGLTDDEVVALAVRREKPWFGTLPTVDVNDESQLFGAATRGTRSLAVRGLLSGEDGRPGPGLGADAVSAVAEASGAEPSVVAFAALAADLFTPLATTVGVYPLTSGEYVIDACLSSGIHDMVVRSRFDAQDFLTTMVGNVLRDGLQQGDGVEQDAVFVVLTSSTDGQRIAVIDAGQAAVGDITKDGDTVGVELGEPSALPEGFLTLT